MADDGFDFSEVLALAADLGEVSPAAGPLLNSALQHTAVEVKKAAQESVRGGSSRWKAAPAAIDYDVNANPGSVSSILKVEVGYNKGRRGGPLGNLREFGAPATNLAPHNDLANALHENEADFQHGLEMALIDAEKKAGL